MLLEGEMTMIERVADAVDRYVVMRWARDDGSVQWSVGQRNPMMAPLSEGLTREAARHLCRVANARAVIEVMREPTEAMAIAAVQNHLPMAPGDPPLWRACWRAMIDAALSEPDAPA